MRIFVFLEHIEIIVILWNFQGRSLGGPGREDTPLQPHEMSLLRLGGPTFSKDSNSLLPYTSQPDGPPRGPADFEPLENDSIN